MTEQIAQIKDRCLIKMKEERAALVMLLENAPAPEQSVGGGSFAAQYQFNQTLAARLRRIDRALDRYRQGLYGSCERCGAPIGERLLVMPEAELCIDCQRKVEFRPLQPGYSMTWSSI